MIDYEDIGIVVIGRNEGKRLKRCFQSLYKQTQKIVYVDSGSTDGSIDYAKSRGMDVAQLDPSTPFSAARARNEGFDFLINRYPSLRYIHFLDGDCELHPEWLDQAWSFFKGNPKCAIVTGRLKERFPEKTIYNLLCDLEWDVVPGKIKSCGGIFTVRNSAFADVQGFNSTVVAGEEPDFCHRLTKMGWAIHRLSSPMALHDADMTRFAQWWRRAVRSGHGYAQVSMSHGFDPQVYGYLESKKIWFWAFLFPAAVVALSVLADHSYFFLFIVYFFQFLKISVYANRRFKYAQHAFAYSFFVIIGRWPQLLGQLIFIRRKIAQNQCLIIEHR